MSILVSKSKLTLWLDRDTIALGKAQAKRQKKSLSAIFVEFIQELRKSSDHNTNLSARMKRLKGAIRHKTLSSVDYMQYLEKKYLPHG